MIIFTSCFEGKMKGYLVVVQLGVHVLFYGQIKATISKFTKQFIEPLVIEVQAK